MANMYLIIAAFITAIVLGRIIIPNILIISLRKRLFDAPDARKIHKRPIPRLGGVTFFPVILCTTCFFTALRILLGYLPDPQFTVTMVTELLFLIAGLTLLYIVGIADDLMGVRYRKKFFVQIICRILSASRTLYQQFLRTFRDLRDSRRYRNSPDHAAGGIHYQCHQPD